MNHCKILLLSAALLVACSDSPSQREAPARESVRPKRDAATPDAPAEAGVRVAAPAPARAPAAGARALPPPSPRTDAGARPAKESMPMPDPAADSGVEEEPQTTDCVTRITYGSAWIGPPNHPDNWDQVNGLVTWDGACEIDSSGNAIAQLSNGWSPHFTGRSGCVISLDVQGSCAAQSSCSTRITYGASWLHPEGHNESFDDVDGVITSNAQCNAEDDKSYVQLSNGWQPHFAGQDSCAISLRYSQCRDLFANPVVAADCPDPGVLQDGDHYVMACTSGGPAFPLRSSRDLVHWQLEGSIFTPDTNPEWAERDFWAPELHRIGDRYLAYFSARHVDGDLAIGVATASSALGPYRDSGAPLVRDPDGAIDAHHFEAPDGTHYLVWKVDGNAYGRPTPLKLQQLTAEGTELTGSAITLLTNTDAWEANSIEGPWLIFESGYYYLFYSGNSYLSAGYGLGVARSSSLTEPFTKAPEPILVSSGPWAGPGHGSAVRAPSGEWLFVFHAWTAGRIGQAPPGRQVLLTRIRWMDGWPSMLGAPSSLSQPVPE